LISQSNTLVTAEIVAVHCIVNVTGMMGAEKGRIAIMPAIISTGVRKSATGVFAISLPFLTLIEVA
jgi:hypothetical protein